MGTGDLAQWLVNVLKLLRKSSLSTVVLSCTLYPRPYWATDKIETDWGRSLALNAQTAAFF